MSEIRQKLERQYNSDELYPNDRVISSSQFVSALKNPKRFYDQYILNKKEYTLPMIIGVIFSEYYAGNESAVSYLKDLEIQQEIIDRLIQAKRYFMKCEEYEKEIRVAVNNYTLRVTLDGYTKSSCVVVENKTGKTQWDKIRVEEDIQLDLQAWAIWRKEKKSPQIYLNSVDLNKNAKKPIQSFKTKRSVAYLKKFEKEIIIPLINKIEDGTVFENVI